MRATELSGMRRIPEAAGSGDLRRAGERRRDGLHWPHRDGLKWPHLPSGFLSFD
jgi:hypothetical protein